MLKLKRCNFDGKTTKLAHILGDASRHFILKLSDNISHIILEKNGKVYIALSPLQKNSEFLTH